MAPVKPAEVSVVMGVYNEAATIQRTLESLDSQRDISLEIIVVNDGSTDGTGELLDGYGSGRSDVQIIHQDNCGLTAALIAGCSRASAPLIARQDAEDTSSADRLSRQRRVLLDNPDTALVSCGAAFHDADGQLLYEEIRNGDPGLMPPHHGSAMFRKADYEDTGGYRSACYVAQDLDLWQRLLVYGKHRSIPEILYQATIHPAAISVSRRQIQQRVARLLEDAARLRASGADDSRVMEAIARVSREQPAATDRRISDYHYFCGSCLSRRDPVASRQHLVSAMRARPMYLRAALRYLMTWLGNL